MEQEVRLHQEENPVQETNPVKKNGKMKRIIGLVVVLLVIAVVVFCASGESDEGKDIYEIFAWGTKIETVFKKLDSLNVDYNYLESDNEIKFAVDVVQGLEEGYGRAWLRFGNSGVLKSIKVEQRLYLYDPFTYDGEIDRLGEIEEKTTTIVETLTNKYGAPVEDNKWQSKEWDIFLSFGEENSEMLRAYEQGLGISIDGYKDLFKDTWAYLYYEKRE